MLRRGLGSDGSVGLRPDEFCIGHRMQMPHGQLKQSVQAQIMIVC